MKIIFLNIVLFCALIAEGQVQFYVNDSIVDIRSDYRIVLYENDDTLFVYTGQYPEMIDSISCKPNTYMNFRWEHYSLSFLLQQIYNDDHIFVPVTILYYTRPSTGYGDIPIRKFPVAFLEYGGSIISMTTFD